MSLTYELDRGEFKLVCPKLPFLCSGVYVTSLKMSWLNSPDINLVFSIKTADKSNDLRAMAAKIEMVNCFSEALKPGLLIVVVIV